MVCEVFLHRPCDREEKTSPEARVQNKTRWNDMAGRADYEGKPVSKYLGHKTIDQTLKTYAHLFAKADDAMIEKLDTMIKTG